MADNNQRFLLFFILGTYFGPALKGSPKSVLQRIAERLPPYSSNQLSGSRMKMEEVGRVYYYVLRKADQSAVVNLPLLHQFFHGNLLKHAEDPSANYPQFPDLFPPLFHPQSQCWNQDKIIENIVFINNPKISCISQEDVERFKRLTGLEEFLLDENAARFHPTDTGAAQVNEPKEWQTFSGFLRSTKKTKRINELMELNDQHQQDHAIFNFSDPVNSNSPALVFFPSLPSKSELSNIVAAAKSGFALTGSAAMRHLGPCIGLIDMGECEDSYLFRISLPGVKRDESEFSCEVESNGKVVIRGATTTGEKIVCRYSQMFEMQTQNLCPSGRFCISFKLPGPVDPFLFSGNFGNDGILEGVVMKARATK
ncbi:hypothetical protein UlMin_029278 [Ulmus minor]